MIRSVIAAALAVAMSLSATAFAADEPRDVAEKVEGADPAPADDLPAGAATQADPEDGSRTARIASAAGLAGVYAGLGVWSYFAWYHDVATLPEFEIGGDGYFALKTYAGGADKMGHFWANYTITRATTWLLELGGWSTWRASVIAGSLSLAFFTYVEIKDGFYYQLSPGDQIGNTLGVAVGVLMDNVPAVDEVIDFRVQYFPSSDYRRQLIDDGDLDIAEDYSGQTYQLALHLKAIPGLTDRHWMTWARYVDLVAGFETRNYLPKPEDELRNRPRQTVFFGVSVNLQHALSELFSGPPRHAVHRIGHGVFEFWAPPYTTWRITETTRRLPSDVDPDSEVPTAR